MTIYQALSWISAGLVFTSIYFNGKKKWWCWFIYLANSAVLVAINIHFRLWGYLVVGAVTSVMYSVNAYKWRKDSNLQRRAT